jgi:hypothetical protein
MKSAVALLALLPVAAALCGQTFKNAEYLNQNGGKKRRHIIGALTFDATIKMMRYHGAPLWLKKNEEPNDLEFKNTAISSVLYERTSKPRYAEALLAWPLLLTHEKKHYLTIQYKTADGTGRYAIFQLDKSNCQEILAAMEAALGIKPERSEEH